MTLEEGLKELTRIDVSEDLFYKILENNTGLVEIVSEEAIKDAFKGTTNKHYTLYDGVQYLVTTQPEVKEVYPEYDVKATWRQVIVRLDLSLPENTLRHTITGTRAYLRFTDMLLKYYTAEEIEECLFAHEAEYDERLIQVHYDMSLFENINIPVKFDNCYKYDINGAHNDALCEIFPKASEAIMQMYNERHDKPLNKAIVNYYCGMLKHRKTHEKTYNWIVQRTTKLLNEGIKFVGGTLVYANTDGFMVYNPDHLITPSKQLGAFKEEFKGTAYVIHSNNYILYQTGDKQFGSAMIVTRKDIDLSKGEFVTYKKKFFDVVPKPVDIKKFKGDVIDYEDL